jgi:hypothetical protein
VQAFIRTESDGILDVSDFIVSGSVERVVNAVSTASLVLRNPAKRFTKPGNPTFRPMDSITIFGSRFKSKPVQLFTGYLDQTPYLQLFPGTCTIRASCTLKRLLHTYFDAGLPHTIQFLSQFGWYADPSTGNVVAQGAAAQSSGLNNTGNNPPTQQEIQNALLTDGSIGNLLWNVLFEIGNWDKDQILIEKLPTGIIATVADIMQSFQNEDKDLEKELQGFLHSLIGSSSGGSTSGAGTDQQQSGGSVDVKDLPPALQKYNHLYQGAIYPSTAWQNLYQMPFNDVAALAEWAGGGQVPGITMAQVCQGEGGMRPGSMGDDNGDGQPDGYGLWAITRPWGDGLVEKYGGYPGMLNPVSNALVMVEMYKSSTNLFGPGGTWHGSGHVTDTDSHYNGPLLDMPPHNAAGQ